MKNIKHTRRNKGFEKDNFLYTSDFNLSSELILGEIEKIYEDINSKNLSISLIKYPRYASICAIIAIISSIKVCEFEI